MYKSISSYYLHAYGTRGTRPTIGTSSPGFTLIELLVTISIIGILAAMVLVNVIGFRERARDTERKRDLLQIQTALELYRTDLATYPASLPNCGSSLSNGTTVYLQRLPCDPMSGPSWGSAYNYTGGASAYTLYSCLENANDADKDATKQPGCSAASGSFTVTSP
jgi:general secretion pathway protein G